MSSSHEEEILAGEAEGDQLAPREPVEDTRGGDPEAAPEAETGSAEGDEPRLPLSEVQAGVEALLYAAGDPMSVRELKKALPEAPSLVRAALGKLQEEYARDGRGLQIVEVAGGWQITTRPEYHEFVGRLFESPRPSRLSLQALETLAVIAYRQPITVPEIMELRGVRSAGVVRTLLEKKLVKIVGRKNVVGRPLLYGTTKEFLLRFGLKDLKDLPQLKDMSEVFGDEVAQQLEELGPVEPLAESEIEAVEDETIEPETDETDETREHEGSSE